MGILYHRERMVKRGISAEALRTYWCLQNGNDCMLSWTQQKSELNECTAAQLEVNRIATDTDNYPEGGLKTEFCMTRPFDCDGRQDVSPEDRVQCPKHWGPDTPVCKSIDPRATDSWCQANCYPAVDPPATHPACDPSSPAQDQLCSC